jgi:plastocyanin
MNPTLRASLTGALLCAPLAGLATAQQFTYQPGLVPGPARWSEGVEAADVDLDGDLDLFFADGEGFSTPGAKRQNVLLINRLVETGALGLADESVARLGARVSNAKGVATGDVDGDGFIDAVFANGFNTDPPFLYHNRGSAQPGFFDEEGAARGLGEVLNSAGAGFGDLDDDGDLDLVVCDSGASFLGGPGDRPALYLNDGAGNFTEKQGAGWAPPVKNSQMDVQFADVDGDWDLDFVGYCRGANSGGNHYLLLNDGDANFTDASSLLPNGSTSCYEAELGDLDGDTDPDIFMVSLSGFAEGAVRNQWVEGGQSNLAFTVAATVNIQQDDNEISLCDHDDDGDLDAFVGSLGTRERLWRNDGGFSFGAAATLLTSVSDSTLDCTHADLDNDGDYDFITAQGESNPGNWVNKVYVNSGPADSRAPVVVGEAVPDPITSDLFGPWVARARVRDAVMDDGKDWVRGVAHFVVNPAPQEVLIDVTAAGFSPALTSVPAGTSVIFRNASATTQSVTSTTAPYSYDSGPLAPGQLFNVNYVRAGLYRFTSSGSGSLGAVSVSGATSQVAGTDSGGGIRRFAMTGDMSAAGSQLFYELEFTDWAGNVTVSTARGVIRSDAVGAPFCSGDGSGTACPCGAVGAPGAGCPNSASAAGAALSAVGSNQVAGSGLTLVATGCPGGRPGLFFQGALSLGPGVVFGDGLRCAGGQVVRLEVVTTDAVGQAGSGVDVAAVGGASPGQTLRYQFWFRDPAGPCGGAFNTTNGVEVSWN